MKMVEPESNIEGGPRRGSGEDEPGVGEEEGKGAEEQNKHVVQSCKCQGVCSGVCVPGAITVAIWDRSCYTSQFTCGVTEG